MRADERGRVRVEVGCFDGGGLFKERALFQRGGRSGDKTAFRGFGCNVAGYRAGLVKNEAIVVLPLRFIYE